jgi:hypothetical protein
MLNRCRMDKVYAVVGAPWPNTPASVSEPMMVKIRKANIGPDAVEAELEATSKAAQISHPRKKDVKRNRRNNRRNGRGSFESDHVRR